MPLLTPAPSLPRSAFGSPAVAFAAGAAALLAVVLLALVSVLATAPGSPADSGGMPSAVPAVYVPMYAEAERAFNVSRFLLAAIHAQETDFGRSTAPGVHSGVNTAGCCAGPMQFNLTDTWAGVRHAYHQGQRPAGDYPDRAAEHPSPYDPFDAIMAAGLKLSHQGASLDLTTPGTRAAVLAYNRADWYADQVLARATAFQRDADHLASGPLPHGTRRLRATAPWLAPVPGFPQARCDQRILADLTLLIRRYHLAVGDCFATSGHATDGEHPLGLGVDLVPGRGGSWNDIDQLAAWAEPHQNRPRPPFRWVGYNGDPNHGRGNHLHLSWNHAPAAFPTQSAWVLVLAAGI